MTPEKLIEQIYKTGKMFFYDGEDIKVTRKPTRVERDKDDPNMVNIKMYLPLVATMHRETK